MMQPLYGASHSPMPVARAGAGDLQACPVTELAAAEEPETTQ